MGRLSVRVATSSQAVAATAVDEVVAALQPGPGSTTLVFFSSSYGDALAPALARVPGVVLGCSSAGQLTERGYQVGGLTAVSFQDPRVKITPHLVSPLTDVKRRALEIAESTQHRPADPAARRFGLLLVDGLARMEEVVTAAFYQALGNVPLIGGSAGDDLRFQQTQVYWRGQLLNNAAILTIFETSVPFRTFRFQHFAPTVKRLVVTAANPELRTIQELNGIPAVEAYAEQVGCPIESLDSTVFARNPLMLRIGDDYFIRSIQAMHPDGSLSLYCAIEEGLVLSLGFPVDSLGTMLEAFDDAGRQVGGASLILGCDCILRRQQFENEGVRDLIGRFMGDRRVIGFSTYGEQYNGVHVNQTFTGVAFGGA